MAQATAPRNEKTIKRAIRRRRWEFVSQLDQMLQVPMVILAFVWVGLIVYNLAMPGPNPEIKKILAIVWYIFAAEFVLRGLVAPSKREFLKHNWLAAISIVLPALRTLQIFNAFAQLQVVAALGGTHSIVLLILTSVNRGMAALHKVLRRRGTGYITALTAIVLFSGAAGMLNCEKSVMAPNGIHDYPTALYWTMMLLTTIGSDYWPQTPQGKLLCVTMSLYAVAILGYIAATLASFFIGKDANDEEGDVASEKELRELRQQLTQLRKELQQCTISKQ